jgi:REP element-mobilizing transposase RayT
MIGIRVYAYYVMLDHLHLLKSNVLKVDVPRIIYNFIKLTSVIALRRFNIILWQWRHYRQINEDPGVIADIASHILDNPSRSGSSCRSKAYPYRGTMPDEG